MARHNPQKKAAEETRLEAWNQVQNHPLFSRFRVMWVPDSSPRPPEDFWAMIQGHPWVEDSPLLTYHPKRIATVSEWVYVFAHCLLHVGFGHLAPRSAPKEWNAACDGVVSQFLAQLKLGKKPEGLSGPPTTWIKDEEALYRRFCAEGIDPEFLGMGTAGHRPDMIPYQGFQSSLWTGLFAEGIRDSASQALEVAGGYKTQLGQGSSNRKSLAETARQWFMGHFPMLGALAASFRIIEDRDVCARMKIDIAAVSGRAKEIYINPSANLTEGQCRFVIAHELLHVGLRHEIRCQGRDFELWNGACDFVINQWLLEMRIGDVPPLGGLLDPRFVGMSAEAVYDIIVRELKKMTKLRGFCANRGDMLDLDPSWWNTAEGCDLDRYLRECLLNGLACHEQQARGTIPAGLIEEIRALAQPPIPWDVQLAQWFDVHLPTLEKRRTYARLSRRQSSTPEIPRPAWTQPWDAVQTHTFGVLLDTSGSMDRGLLAQALGSIASYAQAREVSRVRVVFCDAQPYDQGYMEATEIAERVKVKGRGGTVLQPGIELLEKARDFPEKAPLLIITDGWTDTFTVRREHAFLMPISARLPFSPRGPVFRIPPRD